MQVYQYLLEAVNINLLIPKFIIILYVLYYSYTSCYQGMKNLWI